MNASPLIFLSRGNRTHILRYFAHRILVPEAVVEEIRRKGGSDITSQTLENTPWIDVVSSTTSPPIAFLGKFHQKQIVKCLKSWHCAWASAR